MSSFSRRLTAVAVCAAISFGGLVVATPANAAPVSANNGIMVQPSNARATVSTKTAGTATIQWDIVHPSAIIYSYTITVYTAVDKTAVATTTTTNIWSRKAVFDGLANGTYYATVTPRNQAGVNGVESDTAPFTIGAVAAPAAPTNVTIGNITDGFLTVNWSDANRNGANAPTAYRITYTNTVTGVEKTVDVPNSGTLSRQLKVLVHGQAYSVSVSAIKGARRSAEANAAATSIPGLPPKGPSAVTVINDNDGYLTVNWTDAAATSTDAPGKYRITYTDTVTNVTKTVDVINNGTLSRQLKVLNAGHPYTVKVSAIKRGVESQKKAAAGTKTPAYQNYAPSAVTATSATAGQLTVNWTDSYSNAEGKPTAYRITYTNTVTGVVKTVDVPNDGNKSRTLKTLVGGNAYSVSVAAIRTGGTSTATAAASSVTVKGGSTTPPVVPSAPYDAPTAVTVSNPEDGTLTVNWTKPTTRVPLGYRITITDTVTNEVTVIDAGDVSSKSLTGLTAGRAYSIKVSGTGLAGESDKTAAAGTHTPTAPAGNGSGSNAGVCAYQNIDPLTGELPAGILRPSVPTNIQVVADANDAGILNVDWDAPTNWNGTDIVGYNYVVTDQVITDWTNPQEFSNHVVMNSGRGTLVGTTFGSLEEVQAAVSNGQVMLQGQFATGNYQPQQPTTPVDRTLYIYVLSIRGYMPAVPSQTDQPCLISNDIRTMTPLAYTFKAQLPGPITSGSYDAETGLLNEYVVAPRPSYFPNQVAVPQGVTVSKIQARLVHNNMGSFWNTGRYIVDSPVFDVTREPQNAFMEGAKAVLVSDLLAYVPSTWSGSIQFRVVYSNGDMSAWGTMASDIMVQSLG